MNNETNRLHRRYRIGRSLYGILRFFILFGLSFIILKPILSKFLLSLMSPEDILDNTVRLLSRHPSTYYWKKAFEQMYLPESLINSVVLSLLVAIVQTFSCTLVGYGLARFKFRGRNIAFAFVIIMLLVPYQVISIAQYQSFVNMHLGSLQLVDTFLPLLILSFTGLGVREGLYIYLMRQNFRSLSVAIEEAAYIDGAGVFRTFFSVMLPNARTMLMTVFLFSFCWQWTDNTYTSLYLIDTKVLANTMGTILVRVGVHIDNVSTQFARCAASIFVALPLVVLFVFCQRNFVKSIAQSGLSST